MVIHLLPGYILPSFTFRVQEPVKKPRSLFINGTAKLALSKMVCPITTCIIEQGIIGGSIHKSPAVRARGIYYEITDPKCLNGCHISIPVFVLIAIYVMLAIPVGLDI
jgi:hypothetical protein